MKARWYPFNATTEGGNKISGKMCSVHGAGVQAGSLHVERCNREKCSERIYSMPEISEYVQYKTPTNNVTSVTVSEKLDGTAIMFSPLFVNGRFVEVIRRTRGMPVLTNMKPPVVYSDNEDLLEAITKKHYKQWKDLVDACMGDGIKELCETQRATLVFELYGARNRHAVKYGHDIDMALHTMIVHKRILPFPEMLSHANRFDIETVRFDTVSLQDLNHFLDGRIGEQEKDNNPEKGVYLHEGVVIALNRKKSASLYKVKPPSMKEYFRESGKPTPITIRAELDKIVEFGIAPEYGSAIRWLKYVFADDEPIIDDELMTLFEKEFWMWRRE